MASKHSSTSPSDSKTMSPPAGGSGLTTQASDRGVADLSSQPPIEVGKKVKIIQKAQVDPSKEKTNETPFQKKTPPSPTTRPQKYTLEIWLSVESAPGEYAPPGEDTYGVDFVKDTLNLAYPGCTGVYLAESGHLVAFYGKKNATGVELSVEQGMEACQVMAEIPSWMGKLAKFKVRAVSLPRGHRYREWTEEAREGKLPKSSFRTQ